MGKKLIITEKPSVARDIAKVLGVKNKSDGYLVGDNYIITWAVGHLIKLLDPEEYDTKYKQWNMDTLPIIPDTIKIKPIAKTRPQYQIIKKLMNDKEVTSIICATDSGREGELIFRYIYDYSKCKKSVERLWISSMTDQAIKKGFENLKPSSHYDNLYYSAKCRSHSDWLVGINATRAFTLQYGTLLSVGRVQTPTLAIIVDRHLEIEKFVPDIYYEVVAKTKEFEAKWIDMKENSSKIKTKELADSIEQKIQGKNAVVDSIKDKEKKEQPPLLYDLTQLQRDANKDHGFSAQKTLNIAQSLYEKHKAITYPRTDSRYLTKDMKGTIKTTLGIYAKGEYERFITPILESPKLPLTNRIINDSKVTDHHAIIPTDRFIDVNKLTNDERKIFNLVLKRFIAVFYPAHIYTQTTLILDVENEKLITKGKVIKEQGWMIFYKPNNKKKEQRLPMLKKGDIVDIESTNTLEKETTPPRPYNESSLLSAMENPGRFVEDETLKEELKAGGLGTPATRASIIERLIKVGYIKRAGKQLIPTDKGIKLIDVLPFEIKSAEMTGKWERALGLIERGDMQPERFMQSIQRYVIYLISCAKQAPKDIQFEKDKPKYKNKSKKESLGDCPVCNKGTIYENSKAYYCSRWREKCQFTLWKNELKDYGIPKITKEMIKTLDKDKIIKSVEITKPQTKEQALTDITWRYDAKPYIQLQNQKIKGDG